MWEIDTQEMAVLCCGRCSESTSGASLLAVGVEQRFRGKGAFGLDLGNKDLLQKMIKVQRNDVCKLSRG